jgi:nucleoside 2-deoxyribosyltransferase
MARIYWAAPLFNDEERAFNILGTKALEDTGHSVFLPQRDAGELGTHSIDIEEIYSMDITGLNYSDVLVAVLNGRALDEGTVFEMGYAAAKGMPIFAICSDKRQSTNAMFAHVNWCKDIHELVERLKVSSS